MGPFYPNVRLEMKEVGDLVPYTPQAILRVVEWTTDEEGYRNAPNCTDPQIVILGDSMAVGTGLTENDTIASQVARQTHQCVRSFAGGNLGQSSKRISALGLHPKQVMIVISEKVPGSVRELVTGDDRSFHFFDSLRVRWIHLRKNLYWNFRSAHGIGEAFLRSYMNPDQIEKELAPSASTNKVMQFAHEQGGSEGLSDSDLQSMVQALNQFAEQVNSWGGELIVSIVPNKESVYFKEEGLMKPRFNDRFRSKLGSAKFVYLDLISLLQEEHEKSGKIFHQLDDTHWNAEGVRRLAQYFIAPGPTN